MSAVTCSHVYSTALGMVVGQSVQHFTAAWSITTTIRWIVMIFDIPGPWRMYHSDWFSNKFLSGIMKWRFYGGISLAVGMSNILHGIYGAQRMTHCDVVELPTFPLISSETGQSSHLFCAIPERLPVGSLLHFADIHSYHQRMNAIDWLPHHCEFCFCSLKGNATAMEMKEKLSMLMEDASKNLKSASWRVCRRSL